eukprot:366520-Chlamydomonas_euryale.AAC.10
MYVSATAAMHGGCSLWRLSAIPTPRTSGKFILWHIGPYFNFYTRQSCAAAASFFAAVVLLAVWLLAAICTCVILGMFGPAARSICSRIAVNCLVRMQLAIRPKPDPSTMAAPPMTAAQEAAQAHEPHQVQQAPDTAESSKSQRSAGRKECMFMTCFPWGGYWVQAWIGLNSQAQSWRALMSCKPSNQCRDLAPLVLTCAIFRAGALNAAWVSSGQHVERPCRPVLRCRQNSHRCSIDTTARQHATILQAVKSIRLGLSKAWAAPVCAQTRALRRPPAW